MGYSKCNEDDYERHVERLSSKGLNMSPDWTRFPTDARQLCSAANRGLTAGV